MMKMIPVSLLHVFAISVLLVVYVGERCDATLARDDRKKTGKTKVSQLKN